MREIKAILNGEGYDVFIDGVKAAECLSIDEVIEIEEREHAGDDEGGE